MKDSHLNSSGVSSQQASMWYMQNLSADNSALNIYTVYELSGDIYTSKLLSSIEKAQVSSLFRTRLLFNDDQLVSEASDQAISVPVECINSSEPEIEAMGGIREFTLSLVSQTLDLSQYGCMRIWLIKISDERSLFIMASHLALMDEASFHSFVTDFCDIYRNKQVTNGKGYHQFIANQQQYLSSDRCIQDRDFWNCFIETKLPTLSMGYSYNQVIEKKPSHEQIIDFPLARFNNLIAAKLDYSIILLCAYSLFVMRYSSQNEIVVSSMLDLREEGFRGQVGNFSNLVPLRLLFDGKSSFLDWVCTVKRNYSEVVDHGSLPFAELVKSFNSRHAGVGDHLLQILFSYVAEDEIRPFENGGLVFPIDSGRIGCESDIEVKFVKRLETVRIKLRFDSSKFSQLDAEALAGKFPDFLDCLLREPDSPLCQTPSIDQQDLKLLQANSKGQSVSSLKTILEKFSEIVAIMPESIAVTDANHRITYRELDESSSKLSQYLEGLGVQSGSLVGVSADRDHALLTILLGIWKAGLGYLPLDPSFPADRLTYILEATKTKLIIGDLSFKTCLPSFDGEIFSLEDALASDQNSSKIIAGLTGDDVAYVIFTSGSTGKPKGVKVPYRAVNNFIDAMSRVPGISSADHLLAVTTLSFDISVLELILPLTVGAEVEIASSDDAKDFNQLIALLEKGSISILQATPSMWRGLIASGWNGDKRLKALSGGEPLQPDLAKALSEKVGELWNMYGPTETTVWSACSKYDASQEYISIGLPIQNTQCYVLGADLEPLPIGVKGDLYIAGAGVALGYWERDGLTEERFIKNPFADNSCMYNTGDLARWRFDGQLECLGRNDYQVKVRGFRIELGEIEGVLNSHGSINQSVVTVVKYGDADYRLIAYIEYHQGVTITNTELRQTILASLPTYMMPQFFIPVDALPLTPNKKIDRGALPSPIQSHSNWDVFEAPVSNIELKLSSIWCNALNIEKISVKHLFFELGGHSILAVKVLRDIELAFGVSLSLRDIVENTLGQLAALLDEKMGLDDVLPDGIQPNVGSEGKSWLSKVKSIFSK